MGGACWDWILKLIYTKSSCSKRGQCLSFFGDTPIHFWSFWRIHYLTVQAKKDCHLLFSCRFVWCKKNNMFLYYHYFVLLCLQKAWWGREGGWVLAGGYTSYSGLYGEVHTYIKAVPFPGFRTWKGKVFLQLK